MNEKVQTHGNILTVSSLFSFQGVWNSFTFYSKIFGFAFWNNPCLVIISKLSHKHEQNFNILKFN